MMDPYINLLLTVCGVLVSAIAALTYRRIGSIEAWMQRVVNEIRAEITEHRREQRHDIEVLHGRVTTVEGRVVRLETRCDTYHSPTGAAK